MSYTYRPVHILRGVCCPLSLSHTLCHTQFHIHIHNCQLVLHMFVLAVVVVVVHSCDTPQEDCPGPQEGSCIQAYGSPQSTEHPCHTPLHTQTHRDHHTGSPYMLGAGDSHCSPHTVACTLCVEELCGLRACSLSPGRGSSTHTSQWSVEAALPSHKDLADKGPQTLVVGCTVCMDPPPGARGRSRRACGGGQSRWHCFHSYRGMGHSKYCPGHKPG